MSTTTWDELRRVARLLENEIESKLISLNKINFSTNGTMNYNSDQTDPASKRIVFERLCDDLEDLISKLTKSNNDMKDYIENKKSQHDTPTLHHTVRRHRDTLRDYCTEFSRTSASIKHQLEREELLNSNSKNDPAEPIAINNRTKSSDYLIRENESITSTDRLLDNQISIAMSVKENLHSQRMSLGGINRRIQQLSRKYPAINSIMQKIRMKKRKDTIILAAVISTCLIFLFIYIMH